MTIPPQKHRGRREFLMLAAIFLLPVGAAAWLYFSSGWKPATGAQHGELIDPPRTLPDARFRDNWFLVHVTGGSCDRRCSDALTEMRRVRLALDKDMSRVKRALLHSGACCGAGFPAAADADLLLIPAEGPAGATLLSQFPPATDGQAGIYIVDPHGNLLMSYPATGAAEGLLKDLERLLRLSRIG